MCSPHRRGWSGHDAGGIGGPRVLPAQAGVVPRRLAHPHPGPSAPRTGGGGPQTGSRSSGRSTCSPHRRGWSVVGATLLCPAVVLPAQAGVVPNGNLPSAASRGAPRTGGGGPLTPEDVERTGECSPHRRGWSLVEISRHRHAAGAPRTGGGGPTTAAATTTSTPVLPAQAGGGPPAPARPRARGGGRGDGGGGPPRGGARRGEREGERP